VALSFTTRSLAAGVALAAAACGAEQMTLSPPQHVRFPPDEFTTLALATPDGSGQTVHPDHVAPVAPWTGATEYLAATPYTFGDAGVENPSLYARVGDRAWRAPAGLVNPVVLPSAGHLSDPDVVFDPDRGELRLYYRAVDRTNEVRVVTSADGVHWSTPVLVAEAPNHDIVSPAVVRRGANEWLMWSVKSNVGCTAASTTVELRRSSDGIAFGAPEPVALVQPGWFVWHLDVQWIPSRAEYWALYAVKTAGNCTTPAIYLATSPDGVAWTTHPSPVLARGEVDELRDVVYRSTFALDAAADRIRFWYSGARYENGAYVWHTVFQERARAEVFATMDEGSTRGTVPSLADVPPLLEGP
jgi:hypothetical protein